MTFETEKNSLQKVSPIKDPPLRYAGQSLEEEMQELREDKGGEYAVMISFCLILSGMEWIKWYWDMPPHPITMTILAAIVSGFSGWKLLAIKKKVHNLKQARDGERAVGQYLERLMGKGYRLHHDVIGNGFNIDHVLIGPKGIYTIETKTISKPIRGASQVNYDGETILVDGFSPDRDPVIQAKAQANWLRELIESSTGKKVKVRPVVLYPGWFVSKLSKGAEVWVLNPKSLESFLDHEDVRLKEEDVRLIDYHLSRYVRELERKRRDRG